MLLLSVPAAVGGFTLKAHTFIAGASAGVTTTAIDTTGCNLIVTSTCRGDGATGLPSLSDSKGNSAWNLDVTGGQAGTILFIRSIYNPVVGTGHTFTTNSPNGGLFVAAFSGAVASPLDRTNNATTTGTSLATGSVTPSNNGQLLVTTSVSGSSLSSVSSPFSPILDQCSFASGVTDAGGLAYYIQSTAAALNPTWTQSSSALIGVAIATYKSQ